MKSAWKLDEYANIIKKSWGNENSRPGYGRTEQERSHYDKTSYQTLHNKSPGKVDFLSQGKTSEDSVKLFRDKLKSRGARGILGLQRLFKIMDDD